MNKIKLAIDVKKYGAKIWYRMTCGLTGIMVAFLRHQSRRLGTKILQIHYLSFEFLKIKNGTLWTILVDKGMVNTVDVKDKFSILNHQ